jgi:hypothetical protein
VGALAYLLRTTSTSARSSTEARFTAASTSPLSIPRCLRRCRPSLRPRRWRGASRPGMLAATGQTFAVVGPHTLAGRDRTAWLGWEDSNSEMSSQIIPLKARADSPDPSRIPDMETTRVRAAAPGIRSSGLGSSKRSARRLAIIRRRREGTNWPRSLSIRR